MLLNATQPSESEAIESRSLFLIIYMSILSRDSKNK